MANRLQVQEQEAIASLAALGWSIRKIAREAQTASKDRWTVSVLLSAPMRIGPEGFKLLGCQDVREVFQAVGVSFSDAGDGPAAELWKDLTQIGAQRNVQPPTGFGDRKDERTAHLPAASAILDRFLHHAEIIPMTRRSYRLQDRAARETRTAV